MIISISGPGESGKDKVGDWFGENTILRYEGISTSVGAKQYVWDNWGKHNYDCMDVFYEARREPENRKIWRDHINKLNTPPDTLGKLVTQNQDLIVGIRTIREYIACCESLIDLSIWVDRPGQPHDPTMEFGPGDCDITIHNDKFLPDLYAKLRALSKAMNI